MIQIDEGKIGQELRITVEETLNAMLAAEADRPCHAEPYGRTEGSERFTGGFLPAVLVWTVANGPHTGPMVTPEVNRRQAVFVRLAELGNACARCGQNSIGVCRN